MLNDLIIRLWNERAQARISSFSEGRISVIVGNTNGILVPCAGIGRKHIPFPIYGIDVPGQGNCLYHSVWTAARLVGIRTPLGFTCNDHVYYTRIKVACGLYRLLDEGIIVNCENQNLFTICDFVATPNQYLQYSGIEPIAAMAMMLGRTIVVLSCDGIHCVVPFDSSLVQENEDDDPAIIYHCVSGSISLRVGFERRNHYIAIRLNSIHERAAFRNLIRHYRNSFGIYDVINDNANENLAEKSNKRVNADLYKQKGKRQKIDNSSELNGTQVLQRIADQATSLLSLSDSEVELLRRNQNFTKDPRLALLYYHCCSGDPRVHVTNDERLLNTDGEGTVKRLKQVFEKPITPEEISRCQEDSNRSFGSAGDIFACASCCEIINTADEKIVFVKLQELNNFQLTVEEEEQLSNIPNHILQYLQMIVKNEKNYHLNPELVEDFDRIALCSSCFPDPRKYPYSIASGHDYGIISKLPVLNDIARNCVSPVRYFGLEITLSGKHTIGHSICFPSNGPQNCSKVIPCVSDDVIPRVTFIGPTEKWRIQKKRYRNLYEIPLDDLYKWMNVLMHTHNFYKEHGIRIDNSNECKQAIIDMVQRIEDNVIISNSTYANDLDSKIISERFKEDYEEHIHDDIIMKRSAVLPNDSLMNKNVTNAAVDAMLNFFGDSENNDSTGQVITVERDAEPIVEWLNNGNMIASAFPTLFMRGGAFLPTGSWNTQFISHLMRYYDGRFEKNTMFTATLFNQLQRHTAVQRAAKIGSSRANVLQRLGALANSFEFRRMLHQAKLYPHLNESKRLNVTLHKVISLVGGVVPFTPFERSKIRPKLAALRFRYGIPLHWVTIAPPEHDDIELHRIEQIRKSQQWNQTNSIYTSKKCEFKNFTEDLQHSSRERLRIAAQCPALSARAFLRRVNTVYETILRCKTNRKTRLSKDYLQRENGVYGRVAAHAAVVEPQQDGRLHLHMTVFASTYTPEILTRIACSKELSAQAAQWLNSICCTQFTNAIHIWRNNSIEIFKKLPRAYEVNVPDAKLSFQDFVEKSMMRTAITNVHSHSSTCMKGRRGRFMCRLARPTGTHEKETCPILVKRHKNGNASKGIRPILSSTCLPKQICQLIDQGYDISSGKLFRDHTDGPILWELNRPSTDTLTVETNLILSSLTMSHTNSAIINGEDVGDMVEEYQEAYMTKNDIALKGAAVALLSAIEHIKKFPSKAEDSHTLLRTGKYLATRTINSFSGVHEWSHSLMVHALTGNRSFISSDNFRYIFPFQMMEYIETSMNNDENQDLPSIEDKDKIEKELEKLGDIINDRDNAKLNENYANRCNGVQRYSINDKLIFLSQQESYKHRGQLFHDYSPLEFECIVDILPVVAKESTNSNRGRNARTGFPLAPSHPLYGHYKGFIKTKMHTAIFGGPPPPTWDNNRENSRGGRKRDTLAKYLLAAFTPWDENGIQWEYGIQGLLQLCTEWDSSKASMINRQRYRYMRSVMKKGYRNPKNEEIYTDWRNRGVDFWKDLTPQQNQKKRPCNSMEKLDPEKKGILTNSIDVYKLLSQIAEGNPQRKNKISTIQKMFWECVPISTSDSHHTKTLAELKKAIYSNSTVPEKKTLYEITKGIQTYKLRQQDMNSCSDKQEVFDPMTSDSGGTMIEALSSEQKTVLEFILSNLYTSKTQCLSLIHGGGGVGKSFLVRTIQEEIKKKQYDTISTCPTGAGACQLTNGRTFHSAFKFHHSSRLSSKSIQELHQLFTEKIHLIVIDEVSMFKSEFLVLLDERLRLIYTSTHVFGGKSILLIGDFFQLPVIQGVSLCKNLYTKTTKEPLIKAKHLFSLFKVFSLKKQHRASNCITQQKLLQDMRILPSKYPIGSRWSKEDTQMYTPINDDIIRALTRSLTADDIQNDSKWLTEATILVTSNTDRCVLNACMAQTLAVRSKEIVLRWKKTLQDDIPQSLAVLLYNEDIYPELFGYFLKDAPGQILDNANVNVQLGVANGSRCWYHSIAWDDITITALTLQTVENARTSNNVIVDLPVTPQYINVRLASRDGELLSGEHWPPEINLDDNWIHDTTTNKKFKETVIIPISIIHTNTTNFAVKVQDTPIRYNQHAVDLAMAMTIWKSQGSTFSRVILQLEGSTNSPQWRFEHLYVALSRIRSTNMLRCFPLSYFYHKKKLQNLRPSIFTIKWLMDINDNGFWQNRRNIEDTQ